MSGSRTKRRVLALLGGALATLAVAEIALRVWAPFPRDFPWYPDDHVADAQLKGSTVVDPRLGWRFAPNAVIDDPSPDFHVTYDCTAEGFRKPGDATPDEHAQRVVFVGDSFTFGIGVEEGQTFADLVADAKPGVQSLNYGMPGFGVDQMWRALVEHGVKQQPSLVIATFVVDDLNRSRTSFRFRDGWCAKPAWTVEDGELVPRTAENSPCRVARWFAREPYLAEVWRRAENKLGLEHGVGERFELNSELFHAMRDTCAAAACQLVVVHLPQRGAWRPVPAFADALAELDVPFLDLGSLAVDEPRRLFFEHDPHIDADGHRFVAVELGNFLDSRGLFDHPSR